MTRVLALLLLLPLAARAEITVSVLNGGTETPIGSTLVMGPVLAGHPVTLTLTLRTTTSPSILLTRFQSDQAAFQVGFQNLGSGYGLFPGHPAAAELTFGSNTPGFYQANLFLWHEVNGVLITRTIALSGTVLPASALGVQPTCAENPLGTVAFGIVIRQQSRVCLFNIQNSPSNSLTFPISLSGAGFSGIGPTNVSPGQAATYSVKFEPATTGNFSGTLNIGPLAYTLTGVGANPPIPTPILDWQATAPGSAQQRQLSARLTVPSPMTGSGTVKLDFFPNAGLSDDAAIAFLNPLGRSVPFSVQEGSTNVLLGGQPSAVFQTGTTAGQIRFTLTSALFIFESDASATLAIPPATVFIDTAFGTRGAGELQVKLIGYDNTYTIGAMMFTFYNASGGAITAPIQANFAQAFRTFYGSGTGGSTFQVIIRFPVTGDIGSIAGVEVDLTNAAGTVKTARLAFP